MLNFIAARGWTDYNSFSSQFAFETVKTKPKNSAAIIKILQSYKGSFYSLNGINPDDFINNFPIESILEILRRYAPSKPLTFSDVFRETNTVTLESGKVLALLLKNIDERVIQDAIQDSMRELNATNATERDHDSVLEASDREHPVIVIDGVAGSFSLVVKGYKSTSSKTITSQDIIHQIIKSYNRTKPDHILLVIAKNLADGVISELVEYGKSVGKEYLIILCDPVNLARFLKARNIL